MIAQAKPARRSPKPRHPDPVVTITLVEADEREDAAIGAYLREIIARTRRARVTGGKP